MLRILHYSDLHGKLPEIPKKHRNGDTVLVFSGDVADNYPEETFTPGIKDGRAGEFRETSWVSWNFRLIDKIHEKELQEGWLQNNRKYTLLLPKNR